jgi:hypothetical protein
MFIYMVFTIHWSSKEITQHQALVSTILMFIYMVFTILWSPKEITQHQALLSTIFNVYLHGVYDPLVSERNYPTSSTSKYNF